MQVTEEKGYAFPAMLSDSHPPSSPFCFPLSAVNHSSSRNQGKLPGPAAQANSTLLLRSQEKQAAACSAEPSSSCAPGHRACCIPLLPTARGPELPGSRLQYKIHTLEHWESPSLFAGEKLGYDQLVGLSFMRWF